MSVITFLNQTKFFQAKRKVEKEKGKENSTPEDILDEYIKLAGAYMEEGKIMNSIGNPRIEADTPKIKEKIEEAKNPATTKMGKKRRPEVKPTMQVNTKKSDKK